MKRKTRILIIDPISFRGGSKVATEIALRQLDLCRYDTFSLTADRKSWNNPSIKKLLLREPKCLMNKEEGILYFIRHLFIAMNILLAQVRIGKLDIVIGASGPGVDLSLYLFKPFFRYKIIQLVHGPVATSKTIARCLITADKILHLESTKPSILKALSTIKHLADATNNISMQSFNNGICESRWPAQCQYTTPTVFWASSLLEWKGLDLLINTLTTIDNREKPETHICYIRPSNSRLPSTSAPVTIHNTYWYEDPKNIDCIRSSCNIFISTSKNEPFGLSILEAMAAGHCVLIPADGAYWDKVLEHNVNCLKYPPGDRLSLAKLLRFLNNNPGNIQAIGTSAAEMAKGYKAEKLYEPIVSAIRYHSSEVNVPVQ